LSQLASQLPILFKLFALSDLLFRFFRRFWFRLRLWDIFEQCYMPNSCSLSIDNITIIVDLVTRTLLKGTVS